MCAFDGNLLVAIAPVVDSPSVRRAQLYVPPSISDDRLRLLATDDPTGGANSPGLLAFLASTAAGRRAAQLERLGRFAEAASAWDACAERWASEGDDVRARLAHSYGYGARARAGERLGRDYDVDQVEVDRPVPPPYLGAVVISQ